MLSGAFGRVFKGILQREHADGEQGKTLQVAIKTIKSECQNMTTPEPIVLQFIAIVDACACTPINKNHHIESIHTPQPCIQIHFQSFFSTQVISVEICTCRLMAT